MSDLWDSTDHAAVATDQSDHPFVQVIQRCSRSSSEEMRYAPEVAALIGADRMCVTGVRDV